MVLPLPKKKKIRKKKGSKKTLTRKELRKNKQKLKKENKRLFFSKQLPAKPLQSNPTNKKKLVKKQTKIDPSKIPVEELLAGNVGSDDNDSIDSDFSDEEVNARMPPTKAPKKKEHIQARPDDAEVHRREMMRKKDLENASKKRRIKNLLDDNEEEDRIIARLEKKLKMNKTKDKNRLTRKMFNDGLDYALEICLDDDTEKVQKKSKDENRKNNNGWIDGELSDDMELGEDEHHDSDSTMEDTDDENSNNSENDDSHENDATDRKSNGKYKEDIYGRKRDKDGNIINDNDNNTSNENTNAETVPQQKYIPPHQRALMATKGDAQALERLYRSSKGLLNRLSEANLHKIAVGVEELYMKNSRYHMNQTLTKLLNESLIGRTMTNERMIQEHMVLLAYLHAHIGNEIGAHFLQEFVKRFDNFIKDIKTLNTEDKHMNNLILVLSYLYIFKIYEHRLLHEIIARLADNLCEKSIECLLLIFQSVGFKLRKDDPLQFKQMMNDVQKKIAESPLELKENLRLKFMVDILNAVKNNNMNKMPQFDPELAENLRKRLKAMLRNDKYVVTLNITIDDLLRADKVGKWWVVGSAWSGNIEDINASKNLEDKSAKNPHRFSEKLLNLAKKLKMNTDERRNIFCIIMSAEDYVDAFEKISHLNLKDQRTIAYVIIHCCLHEKQSNPYYAHLALKFCNSNRSYQLAFQYASWDRINDIEAMTKMQIKNLANFLQHLILNGGLALSVLKVIDFLELGKLSFLLMRDIIVGLLLPKQMDETQIFQVFERLAKNTKLNQFKNSIRLFMQHFLLNNENCKLKLNEDDMILLKKRIDHIDNILAYIDL